MVRFAPGPLEAVDGWITSQNDPQMSRPEAIRQLVALGLETAATALRKSRSGSA